MNTKFFKLFLIYKIVLLLLFILTSYTCSLELKKNGGSQFILARPIWMDFALVQLPRSDFVSLERKSKNALSA